MPANVPSPRRYSPCGAPAAHRDHLCLLMERGETEEIHRRTAHPAFACANCGALADAGEDLCNPRPLRES